MEIDPEQLKKKILVPYFTTTIKKKYSLGFTN